MIRLQWIGAIIFASGITIGCGDSAPVRPARPARPDFDVSAGAVATEPAIARPDESVASAAPTREISLTDSTWTDLLSFVEQQTGKLVVVDVWSTACEPCMTEFPHLIDVQERFANDVVAVSFDVDYAGIKNKPPAYYRERVIQFLTEQRENQVVHRMCTTAAEELFDEIKLDSIPAVYIFDRDGTLLKRFDGSSGGGEGVSYTKQVIPFVGDHVEKTAGK